MDLGGPSLRPSWISDAGDRDRGLRRWLRIAREHWDVILPAVIITFAAAVGYSLLKAKTYEAQAVVLASSVARDDPTFTGISVLRESSDPTRDVETLAKLIDTAPVAAEAAKILGTGENPAALQGAVDAQPISQSFLVAITAKGSSAEQAAARANAFGDGLVAVRKQSFNDQLQAIIHRLEVQLQQESGSPSIQRSIAERIANLGSLRDSPDPSIQFVTRATPPTKAAGLPLKAVAIAAIIVGLGIGLGIAFLSDALRSRVRSERDLLQAFSLSILARVPLARGRKRERAPLSPEKLSPGAGEAYRTLRQNIAVFGPGRNGPRTMTFTSAAPAEGKSTSVLNTAVALAGGGSRVLIVDTDLRNPGMSTALSMASRIGVLSVLTGAATLAEAVVKPALYGGNLMVLMPRPGDPPRGELITNKSIRNLIEQAAEMVDYIVFDTPPLGLVADALPIATEVDDVFLTVRRGATKVQDLTSVCLTLARHEVTPRGFILIGTEDEGTYYGKSYTGASGASPDGTALPEGLDVR